VSYIFPVRNLRSKSTRQGTYNRDLTKKLGTKVYTIKISKYLDSKNVKNEWTDYLDIGKEFYGGKILTENDYILYENRYIQLIKSSLKICNIYSLLISDFEDYRNIKNNKFCKIEDYKFNKIFSKGMTLNLTNIELISRLSFRTHVWCELINIDLDFKINFSDRLYFYIQTNDERLFEILKNKKDYNALNISLTSPEFEL